MNQMVRPSQVERSTPVEALAGTIERVTFHNAENGFCVLKVQARGKRDLVTVVGHAPGDWGRRVDHRQRRVGQRPDARASVQGRRAQGHAADRG